MIFRLVALGFAAVILAGAETVPNPLGLVNLAPTFKGVAIHADGRTAWLAADNGLIYRSADGGITWTGVDVAGSGGFNAVRFLADGKRGWAVGDQGIARTVDGGLTWTASNWAGGSFNDVIFDAAGKRGFATSWSRQAKLVSTEDGGVSWKRAGPLLEKEEYGANSIAFDADFKTGLIGGTGFLLRTVDGGRTWAKEQGAFESVQAVAVSPDGTSAWALANPTTNFFDKKYISLFRKMSPAGPWVETRSPLVDSPRAAEFPGRSVVIATEGGIYVNPGGGERFERVLEGKFESVAFASGTDVALAVGKSGTVARSEDGGRTWRLVFSTVTSGLHLNKLVVQPGSTRVWAVGDKLLRTDEWGRNFQVQSLPKGAEVAGALTNMAFSSDGRLGWVTSAKGSILRTVDHGDTWMPAEMKGAHEGRINGIAFDSEGKRGIAAGTDRIWVSSDGGEHWEITEDTRLGAISLENINDLHLSNNEATVWAVTGARSGGGKILRSDDFGKTWKSVTNPSEASLYRISFSADGRFGWIGGSDNTILWTQNRGRTWSKAEIFRHENSRFDLEIDFLDLWFDATGKYGWAGAASDVAGGLFRSVDFGRTWTMTDEHRRGCCSKLALTPDGLRIWAFTGSSVYASEHGVSPPLVTRFSITPEDNEMEIAAKDADTPSEDLLAIIQVAGDGLDQQKAKRTFWLPKADAVTWQPGLFRRDTDYTFQLQLTDGWNIAVRDFVIRKGTAVTEPGRSPAVSLEVPALRGVDVRGVHVLLDGRPVDNAEVLSTLKTGEVRLTPSPAVLQTMRDGFHALALTRGGDEVVRRIGFYKQQLSLKLFRPYAKSYALIIAVGEYPAASGYRKLPNAVPQARDLEKALRAQGFEVLPPLYDQAATKAGIEAAIRRTPAGPEDRLFLYFGGHGDDEKGFQGKAAGYIVPYDGSKNDLWTTAIPLENFAGVYSTRLRAKHVLFALDSCQSGLAVSRGATLDLSSDEMKRFKALAEIEALASESGRTILTAGTGGQDALDLSGGIFTTALTDAIRGKADADSNGVVDYFELFSYVWGQVTAVSRQWTRKQQPADQQMGNGRWVFVYQ